MPNSNIVFSPEIDERQLDREVGNVNDQLSEVGQDVPLEFDEAGVDLPGGVGDGMDGGGLGGVGGAGGAGAIAGLASKIPTPVAGIATAAALPIAISGGVGMSMLSAMQDASGRLQTSTSILGQAAKNVWRPIGNRLDELLIRDKVLELLAETREFGDAIRNLPDTIFPRSLSDAADYFEAWGELADVIGVVIPGFDTIGDGLDYVASGLDTLDVVIDDIVSRFNSAIGNVVDVFTSLPRFNWPSLPTFKWPDLPQFNWPNVGLPEWPSAGRLLNRFPTISADALISAVTGGGDPGGGFNPLEPSPDDTVGFPNWSPDMDEPVPDDGSEILGLQSGGRVTQSGVARVHRGELVASPDRLVSELANAIQLAGNNQGGGGNVEQKLDELNRNVKRLAAAMSETSLEVDGERFGRLASEKKRNRVADTNPLV